MKFSRLLSLLAATFFLSAAGQVSAVMVLDTIDASSGQADTYFVPGAGLESTIPYFRYQGQDWDWQHNAIATPFTTATLSISAWDVDNPSSIMGRPDEIDEIQAYNNQSMAWETVGVLEGSTDSFSFTTFNLGMSWFDEIASGLMVQILIDQNNSNYWGVSLAKSVLSLDDAPLPNPNPVPVPAAIWLFGSALLGMLGFGRRKIKD